MKIRIEMGVAGVSSTPEALTELVAGIDELGFDSLWLSEVLTGPVLVSGVRSCNATLPQHPVPRRHEVDLGGAL